MLREIAVIDYGSGNVRSLVNALRTVVTPEQEVHLIDEPARLRMAERAVLPGVGAFGEVMRKLRSGGWLEPLEDFRRTGRPFLGICVGMQILATEGHEFGVHGGLGWIRGTVRMLRPDSGQKLPHIGWSPVETNGAEPVFEGLDNLPHFYFVHSFVLISEHQHDSVGWTTYGERFAAAVRRENVLGTQFHPEKSSHEGLRFLANFCRWMPR